MIVILFVSCGDIDSIHEQYLQGEQVYAGKLDTLKIRPGYYRAQLEGQTQFLGNSNQIIIEYDDVTDVYEIEQNNIENGIYKMILPNLDENLMNSQLPHKTKLEIYQFLKRLLVLRLEMFLFLIKIQERLLILVLRITARMQTFTEMLNRKCDIYNGRI